jgi:hypothetical protein
LVCGQANVALEVVKPLLQASSFPAEIGATAANILPKARSTHLDAVVFGVGVGITSSDNRIISSGCCSDKLGKGKEEDRCEFDELHVCSSWFLEEGCLLRKLELPFRCLARVTEYYSCIVL